MATPANLITRFDGQTAAALYVVEVGGMVKVEAGRGGSCSACVSCLSSGEVSRVPGLPICPKLRPPHGAPLHCGTGESRPSGPRARIFLRHQH